MGINKQVLNQRISDYKNDSLKAVIKILIETNSILKYFLDKSADLRDKVFSHSVDYDMLGEIYLNNKTFLNYLKKKGV